MVTLLFLTPSLITVIYELNVCVPSPLSVMLKLWYHKVMVFGSSLWAVIRFRWGLQGGPHTKNGISALQRREGFPGGLVVKNPPAHAIRHKWIWSLDQEDPLEEGTGTHSSILVWRIPWTEEPGRLQSKGSQKARHDWSDLARSLSPPHERAAVCKPGRSFSPETKSTSILILDLASRLTQKYLWLKLPHPVYGL